MPFENYVPIPEPIPEAPTTPYQEGRSVYYGASLGQVLVLALPLLAMCDLEKSLPSWAQFFHSTFNDQVIDDPGFHKFGCKWVNRTKYLARRKYSSFPQMLSKL